MCAARRAGLELVWNAIPTFARSLVQAHLLDRAGQGARRTVSQSMKSIEGWYETPAHSVKPSFRAPQVHRRD
jgi:hypothetical protein